MCAGYPLEVNGVHIRTSEALYQACRFPHLPDVQRTIIEQKSPMTAKMKSRKHTEKSRPDWDKVRVDVMRYSLAVKLAQNFRKFGRLLESTAGRPIVEESKKDSFWGAKKSEDDVTLKGVNALGRLLMELRERYFSKDRYKLLRVEPIEIEDFRLLGEEMGVVDERFSFIWGVIMSWRGMRGTSEVVDKINKETGKDQALNTSDGMSGEQETGSLF